MLSVLRLLCAFIVPLMFCQPILAGSPEPGPLFKKALEVYEGGDLDTAIDLLEKEAQENPANIRAHVYLGEIYFKKLELEKALAEYNIAQDSLTAADPLFAEVLAALGPVKRSVAYYQKYRDKALATVGNYYYAEDTRKHGTYYHCLLIDAMYYSANSLTGMKARGKTIYRSDDFGHAVEYSSTPRNPSIDQINLSAPSKGYGDIGVYFGEGKGKDFNIKDGRLTFTGKTSRSGPIGFKYNLEGFTDHNLNTYKGPYKSCGAMFEKYFANGTPAQKPREYPHRYNPHY